MSIPIPERLKQIQGKTRKANWVVMASKIIKRTSVVRICETYRDQELLVLAPNSKSSDELYEKLMDILDLGRENILIRPAIVYRHHTYIEAYMSKHSREGYKFYSVGFYSPKTKQPEWILKDPEQSLKGIPSSHSAWPTFKP